MSDDSEVLQVLDVETKVDHEFLEREGVREQMFSDIEPPKNYKDPKKIQEWIDTEVERTLKKAALSPLTGRIVAIGIGDLDSDDDPKAWGADGGEDGGEGERYVLRSLLTELRSLPPDWRPVGFNLNRFDLPFIRYRMCVHGIDAELANIPRPWHPRIVDLFDLFGRQGKLAVHLERMFKGELQKSGDGSEVEGMAIGDVIEYVRQDVWCERELARRARWMFEPVWERKKVGGKQDGNRSK